MSRRPSPALSVASPTEHNSHHLCGSCGSDYQSPGLLAKARPISRADVAATLLDLVQDTATARSAVNFSGGV
jgi:hypothetical protein